MRFEVDNDIQSARDGSFCVLNQMSHSAQIGDSAILDMYVECFPIRVTRKSVGFEKQQDPPLHVDLVQVGKTRQQKTDFPRETEKSVADSLWITKTAGERISRGNAGCCFVSSKLAF